MNTIDELLDDLEHECYDDGDGRSSYCNTRKEARAAVDAEIKRMQDRIAELERQLMERNGS